MSFCAFWASQCSGNVPTYLGSHTARLCVFARVNDVAVYTPWFEHLREIFAQLM